MSTFHPHHPTQNRLLAALPPIELADLAPHLELVHLPLGDALCKPGEPLPYAYFPTSSVISIHCLLENGTSSELTSVGREGMLGVSLFLAGEDTQSWASVQSAGYGYRLKAAFLLQEFNEGDCYNACCCATAMSLSRKLPRMWHAADIIQPSSGYAAG